MFGKWKRVRSGVIWIAFICGLTAAGFLTKALISVRQKSRPVQRAHQRPSKFFTEGFDFDLLRGEDNNWKGPSFGEKIDLAQMRSKDDSSPPNAGKVGLLMVVAVNPSCGMCAVATDEMSQVRDKLALKGIPYYVVSLVPQEKAHDFFAYCDSLSLGVPAFQWANNEQPLTSLSTMVAPSHLLLDKNGVILRTWPGSNEDLAFRNRMGRQIVDDTNVIVDTFAALSKAGSNNN